MNLIQAVQQNNLDLVNQLLLAGVDVNGRDNAGMTPLTKAAANGNVPIGLRLIQAGANVNQPSISKITPLMWAAIFNHADFILLLLEQEGIDVNTRGKYGATALLSASLGQNVNSIKLLVESGSNPNLPDDKGSTPLGRIILNDAFGDYTKMQLSDLLLAHGADVNHQDNSGQTVLMYASRSMHSIVDYLLEVPGIDIDLVNKRGQTALFKAAESPHASRLTIIQSLLQAGADPLVKDEYGHLARDHGYYSPSLDTIIKLLQAAEDTWLLAEAQASKQLKDKFMISHRLKMNQTVPQKQLADGIIRRAEYSNLCFGIQTNLNKPGVVALAKSLHIITQGKTKIQLCAEISEKLII